MYIITAVSEYKRNSVLHLTKAQLSVNLRVLIKNELSFYLRVSLMF